VDERAEWGQPPTGNMCQVVHVTIDRHEAVVDLLLLEPMAVDGCEVPPGSTITIRFALDAASEGDVTPVLREWAGQDDLITVAFRITDDEQVVVLGGRTEHMVLVLSGRA
jgi:hypothetical protein